MRDGLSLLDQCASATVDELDADRVYACLGIAGIQQCGTLMGHIANHDTKQALTLLNRLYAEGKDMGALLDELVCLTRDFMILKTAPREGIGMLSGVASDKETVALAEAFSNGELVRMMNVIQQTLAGFTRSASRRMDAELCIVNLCQPELDTDLQGLLARLTRVEDQIRSGSICVAPAPKAVAEKPVQEPIVQNKPAEEIPATVSQEEKPTTENQEAPIGFWADLVAAVRSELPPSLMGFFVTTPNAPLRGVLSGDRLRIICENSFITDIVNKPDILSKIALKASALLGRQVQIAVTDTTSSVAENSGMDQLLQFGRTHSDVVRIKDN